MCALISSQICIGCKSNMLVEHLCSSTSGIFDLHSSYVRFAPIARDRRGVLVTKSTPTVEVNWIERERVGKSVVGDTGLNLVFFKTAEKKGKWRNGKETFQNEKDSIFTMFFGSMVGKTYLWGFLERNTWFWRKY